VGQKWLSVHSQVSKANWQGQLQLANMQGQFPKGHIQPHLVIEQDTVTKNNMRFL
jgi:hypothetical protein